jgi:hypothetical protein
MGDTIGDYATKPLQGALFQKFRDQIMGVTLARDPGPGKTDSGVGKTETCKTKPSKGTVISLVSPGKKAAPRECVESLTRERAKTEPMLVKKIADPAIFNQSSGKSVPYSHVDCGGQAKHLKADPCFTSLIKDNLVKQQVLQNCRNLNHPRE